MYTLQIDAQSAAPLDGVTPLDINAPGVTVDKSTNRTIIVTLDGTLVPAFGRIDPGQVIESQIPRLAGKVLMLIGFSATANGQPFPAAGNTLDRVTPLQGAQEGIQTLANLGDAAVQGMVFGTPELFPLAHLIALTTTVAGPTRLIFVLKELTDEDVVKLGCCSGSPLEVDDEGALVDADTTLMNFIGAGVTAAPAGPVGAVDVTIPGSTALEVDMSLDPDGGPDQPPFYYTDMPAIMTQLALLPSMQSGDPVANRLWLGEFSVASLTPGLYPLANTDIRGGDPTTTSNGRNQTLIHAGTLAGVRLANMKRVVDMEINAGLPGNGGPFYCLLANGTYLENIHTLGPVNGNPGGGSFVDQVGNRWVVDRCQFGTPAFSIDDTDSVIVVEDDNLFAAGSLAGALGNVIMEVRGTGNMFSAFLGSNLNSLDIDIGHSNLTFNGFWSGAESINFGCGPASFTAPGTYLLFPGGADSTSPPPIPIAGPDYPNMIGFKDGVLRGIQLTAGGVVVGGLVLIDVLVGGVIVYSETILITGGAGAFVSTTFGFMNSGIGTRDIAISISDTEDGGSFDYVNVGVLIK